MNAEQIKLALASLDNNHQFWQGIQALMADAVTAEQQNVTIPSLTDAARHYNAGRLAQALDFQQMLLTAKAESGQT